MIPEEQRELAYKLGAGSSPNPCNAELLTSFTEYELDAYTAAVEAKRDAEVAELTRKLAEQQASNKKILSLYWLHTHHQPYCASAFKDGSGCECGRDDCLRVTPDYTELGGLLANERERCVVAAKDAWQNGLGVVEAIRSLK